MTGPRHVEETTSPRGLLVGLAFGVPLIAYGIRGVLVDAELTHPAELARWIVGAAVVHDVVVVPLTLAVTVGLRRLAPGRAWPAVRWALFTSATLAAISFPFVRGYGRRSSIPSLLPRNYSGGLASFLAGVAAVALVWWFVRVRRAPASAEGEAPADDDRSSHW